MIKKPTSTHGFTYVQGTRPTTINDDDWWLNTLTNEVYVGRSGTWWLVSRGSINRGYIIDGYYQDRANSISIVYTTVERFDFSSDDLLAYVVATYTNGSSSMNSPNSSIAGYMCCTDGNVRKRLFSDDSSESYLSNSFSYRSRPAGNNSSLAAYFYGGCNSAGNASISNIGKLDFSQETTNDISSHLYQGAYCQASCNSSLKGYTFGGRVSSSDATTFSSIEKFTFSNESCTLSSGTIYLTRHVNTGFNSSLYGYNVGGANDSGGGDWYISSVEKFNFSSDDTSPTMNSSLTSAISYFTGINSTFKGYVCGGHHLGSSDYISISTIHAITFSVDGGVRQAISALSRETMTYCGYDNTDFVRMFV